jgi:hypothetical protein
LAHLTGLSRSIPAYEGIALALLQSQLGASKDLDAFTSGLAFTLANGLLTRCDSDGDTFNVELDILVCKPKIGW